MSRQDPRFKPHVQIRNKKKRKPQDSKTVNLNIFTGEEDGEEEERHSFELGLEVSK